MIPSTKRPILLLFLALCLLPGCFKQVASKASSQIFYDASSTIDSEEDVELAQQASLTFLKMLEGFYLQNPKDKLTLLLLTRSYAGYAFGFTENVLLANKRKNRALYQKAMARAKRFYSRGQRYGLELLNLLPGMAGAQDMTLDQFEAALDRQSKSRVEDLFWIAFAWGNYLNYNKDSVEAIAQMPKVEGIMKRVNQLEPGYYYGGPDLFLGAYYGSRPKLLGGNPKLAKRYFEKAITETDGKSLMTKVMMAQYYAVQVQNGSLYNRLLTQVLKADPGDLPAIRLMNELAMIRAKILMDRKSLFFTKERP